MAHYVIHLFQCRKGSPTNYLVMNAGIRGMDSSEKQENSSFTSIGLLSLTSLDRLASIIFLNQCLQLRVVLR